VTGRFGGLLWGIGEGWRRCVADVSMTRHPRTSAAQRRKSCCKVAEENQTTSLFRVPGDPGESPCAALVSCCSFTFGQNSGASRFQIERTRVDAFESRTIQAGLDRSARPPSLCTQGAQTSVPGCCPRLMMMAKLVAARPGEKGRIQIERGGGGTQRRPERSFPVFVHVDTRGRGTLCSECSLSAHS
jgi:hypothetical protein